MITGIPIRLTLLLMILGMVSCGGGDDVFVAPYVGQNGGLVGGTQNRTFTIKNTTNETIYAYDFPSGDPKATQLALTLEPGQSLPLTLTPNKPEMRIYFANARLEQSLERGESPNAFNFNSDATVTYSFMEYYYEQSSSRYTIDLSYIDDYSYPLTLTFSDVPGIYTGCEPGFEYGFTSLAAVKEALKKQTDYRWDALIWPANVETNWDNGKYPPNLDRIIGPNKVWGEVTQDNPHGGNWVPHSYYAFMDNLPKYGMQLFNSVSNWDGWLHWTKDDNPSPSNTGYVKALHQVAKADKNGKYGFFSYPRDNGSGEFTYVPDSAACTITIYPHDR